MPSRDEDNSRRAEQCCPHPKLGQTHRGSGHKSAASGCVRLLDPADAFFARLRFPRGKMSGDDLSSLQSTTCRIDSKNAL